VDQVINLRRAGISNKTIAIMLENETKVRKRGGVGRYAVRNSQGGEVIVYQASTPKGVQDFPLGIRANAGGVDRMSVVLGAEKRTPPQKTSKNNKRGFSLHLASFKRKDYADAEMKKLRQNGVQARLTQVDLGGKGKWYRLMVGDYNTQKAAGAAAEILKNQGKIKSFRIVSQ
jgi:cell division protein FtsN